VFKNIFPSPQKNKTSDTQTDSTMSNKPDVDNGLQERKTRTPGVNNGSPKLPDFLLI
jgi:hypothetical protein